MEKPVVILGAGITGLSLAWRLAGRGEAVQVLESQPIVGGLAATVRDGPYALDVGPHSFFSEDADIVATVLNLFEKRPPPAPRTVKFFYRGKYLDYPLTPFNVLFQMGIRSGIRSAASFLRSQIRPPKPRRTAGEEETVEEWAINSFGVHLYRTFFKPYTEQFWKVPCTELSSRAIPTHTRMNFTNTLKLILRRKVSKLDPSLIEREMLPTYYPPSGFGEIAERVAAAVTAAGGRILTGSRATEVTERSGEPLRVGFQVNGRTEVVEASQVVSTIPLNELVRMLEPKAPLDVLAAADHLDYRPLVILGMVTPRHDILGASYIYVMNRPFNRISEMNLFSPQTSPEGENIIAVEIPCLLDSAVWNAPKEEIFEMCIGSLAEDGFLGPGDVKRLILVKASHAYPVYAKDYAPALARLLGHLSSRPRVSTLGRTGEFMYMDIDMCMRRAFDFAERRWGDGAPVRD